MPEDFKGTMCYTGIMDGKAVFLPRGATNGLDMHPAALRGTIHWWPCLETVLKAAYV